MDLLSQISTFVRVVESKSLSAAARAERLSLAAVSRQLSALENELGTTLIARTTRSLSLTAAGQRWYEHALRILSEVEAAKGSVREERSIAGRLTVSSGITLGLELATPVVAALVVEHPRLEVDLRLEDRVADLVADGIDVALRGGVVPPDSASIVARPIFDFRRILVASPAYAKKRSLPRDPQELVRHCCLVQAGPAGPLDEWHFEQENEEARLVRVKHRLRCNAPIGLREAARAGAGIAPLADWFVKDDLRRGRLVRVLPDWEQPLTSVWAVHRVDARGNLRVRAFIDALVTLSARTSSGSTAGASRSRRAKARR